jgi:probable phosphoglycerate mutase
VTVHLVRHGETTWNAEGRVQGWAGASLSGRGREQARATGQHLSGAGVDRLVVSDLRRTQETARLLTESGLDVTTAYDEAWRERNLGDYQGLDRTTVADRCPAFDPEASITVVEDVPGGESVDEFVQRVRSGWTSLLAGLDGDTVAVVTHAGPIRTVVAEVTGTDLSALAREWSPGNCCVTEIDPDGRVVRRDDCAHR